LPGVFISYRREDSAAYAGRLFDILSTEFGPENTFMDVDDIKGGDNFVTVIDRSLDGSDALLAVIGGHWLSATEQGGGRRLDNPHDFVRVEIAKALERGIRVIPVLVGGATLPRPDDLPANLQPLCLRQAVEIRDANFHADVKGLTDVLHGTLHGTGVAPQGAKLKRLLPALLIGLAVIAGVLWLLVQRHKAGTPAPAANVAGEWEATVKYDWGDTYHDWFDFEVDGQELSGTAGFLGTRKGQGLPIWDGKIAGDRISFTTKSPTSISGDDKTYEDKHYYKGTVKGDTIDFTMVTDSSIESHSPIHFTANRVKQ
jgi:TIR domain